jgi:class 3 adenylate cyclase
MGRPQGVVLDQVKAESWDIFVGILWLRFGSPTGARAPERSDDYASGTEEEFDLAYNLWKATRRPRILFYRCLLSPENLTQIDGDSLSKISQFFRRFGPEGSTPGLYSSFSNCDDFERKLERDLAQLLLADRDAADSSLEPATAPPVAESFETILQKRLKVGEPYQVAFLSVDIVEHSRLVRSHRARPAEVQSLIRNFFAFVREGAARHAGDVFSWAGDGGLLIFVGEGYRERAVICGLRLQAELAIFNLDSTQNTLEEAIAVRLAAHEAPIVFQVPASSISSPDLNSVVHLQEQYTEPGEFTLTDALRDNVSPRIAERFVFKGRFEGRPVFSFVVPSPEERPTLSSLVKMGEEAKEKSGLINGLVSRSASLATDELEALSAGLEQFYTLLQRFCGWLKSIDDRWSQEYLGRLLQTSVALVAQEGATWEGLRSRFGQLATGSDAELSAIIQATSSRRSRPVLLLERIRKDLEGRLSGREVVGSAAAGTQEIEREIRWRLARLVKADELDRETILTDLLANFKEPLGDYLNGSPSDRDAVIGELWSAADLVLQNEFLFHQKRKFERRLTIVLSEGPSRDPRFVALRALLEKEVVGSRDEVEATLREMGCAVGGANLEVVWRCLAIGHSDPGTQRWAAAALSLPSVWQLVARPKTPMGVLAIIGMRLRGREPQEFQKIFFDASRGTVLEEVRTARERTAIAHLTKVVLVFASCDFMVETAYFERFDELLSRFLDCVKAAGLRVDYFEKIRGQLDASRSEQGRPVGEVPRKIRGLPLGIQRRLAGEAEYLLWFVGHPDARIALETLRHVTLSNSERVLRIPEINGELMQAILNKPEFFTRSGAVLAALNHPKCTVEFGRVYLPRLRASTPAGAKAIAGISKNPAANPSVRALAGRLVRAAKAEG